MGANRRLVDFQMPDGTAYFRSLIFELIPLIESQYRTDRASRGLFGYSLSGLFVMYALFMEPPGDRHFTSFISEDGSMFEQPCIPYDLEQQLFANGPQLPAILAMSADTPPATSRTSCRC